jgi:hypothetical protein
VVFGEDRDLRGPHAVVEEAAVQQDDGCACAGVRSEEVAHDN